MREVVHSPAWAGCGKWVKVPMPHAGCCCCRLLKEEVHTFACRVAVGGVAFMSTTKTPGVCATRARVQRGVGKKLLGGCEKSRQKR